MTRERSRVTIVAVRERVVEEAHELPREVGAEGTVEARVHHLPVRVQAHRVGVGSRIVAPCSSEVVAFLEYDDVEALAAEGARGGEASHASADDCDSERVGHWDGEG